MLFQKFKLKCEVKLVKRDKFKRAQCTRDILMRSDDVLDIGLGSLKLSNHKALLHSNSHRK